MRHLTAAALICGLAAAAPASAHHSFAMFEPLRTITLNGTVENVAWANPHIWINILVDSPSGPPVRWGLEGGSPGTMTRFGWKRNSMKPGDKVVVVVRPLRDGNPAGSIRTITLASGEVLHRDTEGARPDAAN
jgi:hypothetical protein